MGLRVSSLRSGLAAAFRYAQWGCEDSNPGYTHPKGMSCQLDYSPNMRNAVAMCLKKFLRGKKDGCVTIFTYKMKRINLSITAKIEQAIISFIAPRIPKFIGPDALTMLALLAAVGIGISYFFAMQYRQLYLVAAALYFVHWLGDSLDGRIARDRGIGRPRYGHYVDHIIDSVSVAVILGGLTASATTLTASWLWVVTGFLLLMTHAFLKASVTGKFELSLGAVGPTEARIIGAGFSVLLLFTGNPKILEFAIDGVAYPFTLLDIAGVAAAAVIWLTLFFSVIATAKALDREDRKKWKLIK
jgi:archaetidylinositol phosphate synthase